MEALLTTAFLVAALRATAPVVLAAMGSVVTERAGIPNIGVEGMMLGGAFVAVATTIETGSPWLGALLGAAVGVVLALVMAVVVLDLGADDIVAGFAINVFVAGFTVLVMSELYGSKGSVVEPGMPTLPTIELPIADVPVLGAIATQNVMVWVAFASVAVTWALLFRTAAGLRVRAVGEDPAAAAAAGISVRRVRYAALGFGGLTAGLAGANLAIGYLSSFTRDMTAGRGFIALAAALFGARHPGATAAAALLFGAAEAAGNRLQGEGVPSELVLMLPYVITAVALALISIRRTRRRQRALTAIPAT